MWTSCGEFENKAPRPNRHHHDGAEAPRAVNPLDTMDASVDLGASVDATVTIGGAAYDLVALRAVAAGEELTASYYATPFFVELPAPWWS